MHGGDIYRNEVDLDFSVNINPLGMPKNVKKALHEAVNLCEAYPDIKVEELKKAIGTMIGCNPNSILCGNGASELFLAITKAIRPKKALLPVPSFLGYEKALLAVCKNIQYYYMREETHFALEEDIMEQLTKEIDILFLAQPNNPVGNMISPALLRNICRKCKENNIVVIIDECFIELTEYEGETGLELIKDYSNVIVVRAFTKSFAMPGVRLGYLICNHKGLYQCIENQLPEWNISILAQMAGVVATKEIQYLRKSIELIKVEREYLMRELRDLGIQAYTSETNFILLQTEFSIAKKLLKHKILIRDCCNFKGLHKGYYRIAVKQHEKNKILIELLKIIKK
ncbi:MAG: aminotransferase class I/II-fold pyridoxal phosphate-dependent enzyme [Cellulosilyticum sp.]|nr:aminotransferase class I/II-fold pyridoxal phosphate-dependent enzyme [Cellulosilyticum sp.]